MVHEHSNAPEAILERLSEVRQADRAQLISLPPDDAQAAVERILHPRLWRIEDPKQLIWPGDLADDVEGD